MKPVLILGAGINGAAVARDLAINGVPVCIVDTGDVARGATSRSSRLIHGGLRYLEYRDTQLVRESLRERERLLKLAPHFVRPLRLSIPVERRLGGLWAGFVRFSGLARTFLGPGLLRYGRRPRGLLAVRAGLSMYDLLAGSSVLPKHDVQSCGTAARSHHQRDAVRNSTRQFKWLCSYSDAQLEFPERFVLALLEDGRRAAADLGQSFDVLPRHHAIASESSSTILIEPLIESSIDSVMTADDPGTAQQTTSRTGNRSIEPSVIINATGAWGDRTLKSLGVRSRQLFAGTKGCHLFTTHRPLVNALNGGGIYAEASDGRLVFILPCVDGVLIGTTDDPYSDDPADAVSTPADVDYLVQMVNEVFPDTELTANLVDMHQAGVRPLPRCESSSAAAIPRGHSIEESSLNGITVLTLVGGKLTTCRELAEQVCQKVSQAQNHQHRHSTEDRLIPGAEGIPAEAACGCFETIIAGLTRKYGLSPEQAQTVWNLVGNRFAEIFPELTPEDCSTESAANIQESVTETSIPRAFVRWSIHHEWCTTLEDLIERRLMLIFASPVHRATIRELGQEMVTAGKLAESHLEAEVDSVCQRLQQFYGKAIATD